MEKLKAYYDKITEIINWAAYQGHISEEAAGILHENLEEAYIDIKEEDS